MEAERRLIVNADDFGRSSSINAAVVRAYREGILTSASLMVNGDAFAEAVDLARQNPGLGVGLHLTLVCGRSTLGSDEIPGLVDRARCLADDPVGAGFRYSFKRDLRPQLSREIRAQFEKFRETGFLLDHVNGHLNMHLHPVIFGMVLDHGRALGMTAMRVTRDSFRLSCELGRGRWGYRLSHALIFECLSRRAARRLRQAGIRSTQRVFGLLENGLVTSDYIAALLPRLPAGDSELYSHPSLDECRAEFEALIDGRVRRVLEEQKIRLIRYQDL